jgi:hypothetical protein
MARQSIGYNEFLKKAEDLAVKWETVVKSLNKKHGGQEYPENSAAVPRSTVQQIRIVSAMHVLHRYYEVLPPD